MLARDIWQLACCDNKQSNEIDPKVTERLGSCRNNCMVVYAITYSYNQHITRTASYKERSRKGV